MKNHLVRNKSSGFIIIVSMAQGARIRVEIYLGYSEREKNIEWYDLLFENKNDIKDRFINEKVIWEALKDDTSSRVQ